MKNLIIITIVILSFSSCQEKFDTNYAGEDEGILYVNAFLTTDTTEHLVKIARTVSFNATDENYEEGALVTLNNGDSTIQLVEKKPGHYYTPANYFGLPETTYILNIDTKSGENYHSESFLRQGIFTDSISLEKRRFSYDEKEYYYVFFNGLEPEGLGDGYIWDLYLNDSLYNDSIAETQYVNDEGVDGNYVAKFDIYGFIDPEVIPWDTVSVRVDMLCVKDFYIDFIYQALSQTAYRGSPWDPIPANVETNIEGSKECFGFFVAGAKSSIQVTYIKAIEETGEPKNTRYLLKNLTWVFYNLKRGFNRFTTSEPLFFLKNMYVLLIITYGFINFAQKRYA
ncbi:MAG: DUF4249 domain-containing protein [Bacteroidales bacterium]|nr:DUF4249 domain-containing protein [Bacteroidales bacterium]